MHINFESHNNYDDDTFRFYFAEGYLLKELV